MAGSTPWSIKGVSQDTKDAAKIAARSMGVPMGVWLGAIIRQVAAAERDAAPILTPKSVGPAAQTDGGSGASTHRQTAIERLIALQRDQQANPDTPSDQHGPISDGGPDGRPDRRDQD